MEELTQEAAARAGIRTVHHRMDNGECRYRLIGADGATYCRTEATARGGWQRSHFHKTAREMYIVQQGWMDVACLREGEAAMRRYNAGTYVCLQPGQCHNVRMGPGAVVHTVKFGQVEEGDWHASPALDEWITQALKEQ